MLQLVEVDRYDGSAAVGKLDGLDVVVADSASLVGKRLKVRVERVLDGRAYAIPIRKTKDVPEPLTAEGEAEKPTRKPPARKGAVVEKESEPAADTAEEPVVVEEPEAEAEAETETDGEETAEAEAAEETPKPKKKTRRGSRGGKRRKKSQTADAAAAAAEETAEEPRAVTIHVPGEDLGRPESAEPVEETPAEPTPAEPEVADEPTAAEADEAPKPKKKTRRGSRGGRNRKKKPAAAAQNGAEAAGGNEDAPAEEPASGNGEFDYVPMSEWADELESKG
jgi:ribonuclease E